MKRYGLLKVMVVVVLISAASLVAFACGEEGPSAAVEDFMEATKDKDCETAVDLVDFSGIEAMLEGSGMSMDDMKAGLVEDCKASTDEEEIVDYKIGEETMDGDDKATVEVEATIKSGEEERTETETFSVTKIDDEWKIDLAAGL